MISARDLPCLEINIFFERREDEREDNAVRLATPPNMRVEASLNAIDVCWCMLYRL